MFNEYFNPGTIVASALIILAVLGLIGNHLSKKDID